VRKLLLLALSVHACAGDALIGHWAADSEQLTFDAKRNCTIVRVVTAVTSSSGAAQPGCVATTTITGTYAESQLNTNYVATIAISAADTTVSSCTDTTQNAASTPASTGDFGPEADTFFYSVGGDVLTITSPTGGATATFTRR